MNSICVGCSELASPTTLSIPTRHHDTPHPFLVFSSALLSLAPRLCLAHFNAKGWQQVEKTRQCSARSEVSNGCSRAATSCGCFSKVHDLMMDSTVTATTSPSHATPRVRPLFWLIRPRGRGHLLEHVNPRNHRDRQHKQRPRCEAQGGGSLARSG
jgi:hypothetical protein